jgi:hypothetical protein
MALEALTVDITASATLAADLSDLDPNLRVTSEYVQVIYPSVVIEILAADITASALVTAALNVTHSLVASITASASVTAQLKSNDLSATIFSQCYVTADLSGDWNLASAITSSGTLGAFLSKRQNFSASVSASGTLYGDLAFRVSAGNSLFLTQETLPTLVLLPVASNTLTLTQTADYDYVDLIVASNHVTFIQTIVGAHVLPTATASDNLVLLQSVEGFRSAESILNLTQSASVLLNVEELTASNTLSLTDSASAAGTVFERSLESTLVFTQEAIGAWWGIWPTTSQLDFTQEAVGTLLDIKNFVLLQAPWGKIQTTVILPSPEWGDTENLVSGMTLRRSMNGETYTYVKSNDDRVLKYLFTLPRMKALELEQFAKSYTASEMKMSNWKGEIWKVRLLTNPLDFTLNARYAPVGDRTDVNMEFQGVKISG